MADTLSDSCCATAAEVVSKAAAVKRERLKVVIIRCPNRDSGIVRGYLSGISILVALKDQAPSMTPPRSPAIQREVPPPAP